MTALDFETAVDDLPDDLPVPTDVDAHICTECGAEVFRTGTRGRWPSKCTQCKAKGAGRPATRASKSSPAQAKQAAAVLAQWNGYVAAGMMVLPKPWRMFDTASALAEANDAFAEAAASALATDAKLCRLILKGGGVSGRAGLIMAYGVLFASVAPVALHELAVNDAPIPAKMKELFG